MRKALERQHVAFDPAAADHSRRHARGERCRDSGRHWMFEMCTSMIGQWHAANASIRETEVRPRPAGLMTMPTALVSKAVRTQSISMDGGEMEVALTVSHAAAKADEVVSG